MEKINISTFAISAMGNLVNGPSKLNSATCFSQREEEILFSFQILRLDDMETDLYFSFLI